jgi:large subunit ribosomal protein L4
MATVDIVTKENQSAGSLDLDPAVFEARIRPHLYHAEVRRQLARRHEGTHATRNRALVSGGGAKPYRQKGTGRARQGTTRAPQWKGGGVVFGPVPRSHDHKLPKKMRKAALVSALTQWLGEGSIIVVDDFEIDEYKTRKMADMLGKLGLSGQKVLILIEDAMPKLEASVRNIPGVGLVRAAGLNVYDILRHRKILATKAAIEALQTRLVGAPAEGGSE